MLPSGYSRDSSSGRLRILRGLGKEDCQAGHFYIIWTVRSLRKFELA
jgi:hypothetical protein